MAIPREWIRNYVDALLRDAAKFSEGSVMREDNLRRADHILDMVKAWGEHDRAAQLRR